MTSSQSFFLFLGGVVLLLPMASFGFNLSPGSRPSPISLVPRSKRSLRTAPTPKRLGPLCSISEWRDLWFDFPTTSKDEADSTSTTVLAQLPLKEVCILPFPFSDVLLQGETKQLRLYEERFLQLFDDSMTNHCGVVAMGLVAETGIIQTVPLCEVEAYHRMDGFGIFVTIRVVGRAELSQITQQSPYLKAKCRELTDDIPPNLELPSLVASNIENFMLLLSSMEHRLAQVRERDMNNDDDLDDDDDAEMQRRIQIAKLENRFYDDMDDNDDEEDEDDDDDDDEITELDRRGRYRQAFQVALAHDTQGYRVTTESSSNKRRDGGMERTPQELTALSWAAFCTNILPEEDASFRIQALDCGSLFDRLKLASRMLREKKNLLKQQMDKAGIKFRGEEFDEDL